MAEHRVMTARDLDHTIARLGHAIAARLGDPARFCLVGVVTGGATLAHRLAATIEAASGRRPRVGTLDITLYRDDLDARQERPSLGSTRIPFEITGQHVVLVDDVLYTGRSVRAALDELMDYGRPARVQLAVLIDRGHRELPVAADFVGHALATGRHDRVVVHLREDGAATEGVEVIPGEAGPAAG